MRIATESPYIHLTGTPCIPSEARVNIGFSDRERGRNAERLTLNVKAIRPKIQSKKLMIAIGERKVPSIDKLEGWQQVLDASPWPRISAE